MPADRPRALQRIKDESTGAFEYSDCLAKPLADAPLFSEFESWRPSLESTYKGIFSDLVYGDLPDMDEIVSALTLLKDCLAEMNQAVSSKSSGRIQT